MRTKSINPEQKRQLDAQHEADFLHFSDKEMAFGLSRTQNIIPQPHRLTENRYEDYSFSRYFVNTIEEATQKIAYGKPSPYYKRWYKPVSTSTAQNYWQRKKRQLNSKSVDHYYTRPTNRILNEQKKSESFSKFINRNVDFHINQIEKCRKHDKISRTLIAGPVGSGKSAYSKTIFTEGLLKFWKNGIIPSRVEYKKYKSGNKTRNVMKCVFRDILLITLHQTDNQSFDNLISDVTGDIGIHLIGATQSTFTSILDEIVTYKGYFEAEFSKPLRKTDLTSFCNYYWQNFSASKKREQIIKLLIAWLCKNLSKYLSITVKSRKGFGPRFCFLLSLDGFDCIDLDDLNAQYKNQVAGPLQELLSIVDTPNNTVPNVTRLELSVNHHLVYFMRDTTWTIIKNSLQNATNGITVENPYWIAPPRYSDLAQCAVKSIIKSCRINNKNDRDLVFAATSKIFKAIYNHRQGIYGQSNIIAIFNENARRAQRQIRDFLASLARLYIDHNDFSRNESLNDVRQNKANFINFCEWLSAKYRIYPYLISQSFYLNEVESFSNCIIASNEIVDELYDASALNRWVLAGKIKADSSKFDNIFNYLTTLSPISKNSDASGISYFLFKIRVLQILFYKKSRTVGSIQKHLEALGYEIEGGFPLSLTLNILLRAQLVGIYTPDTAGSMDNHSYYCSASGQYLLQNLLYELGYLGLMAEHSVLPEKMEKLIQTRTNFSRRTDALIEVLNAAYMLKYIKYIEKWEEVYRKPKYKRFRLFDKLSPQTSDQAKRIMTEAIVFGNSRDKKIYNKIYSVLKN